MILAKKERSEDTSEEERQIDEMVYALYGLTAKEIKVVEGREGRVCDTKFTIPIYTVLMSY